MVAAWRTSGSAIGTAWMSVAYVVGYALQGLYFVILARTLGPTGLGTFAGALALVSILAPFAGWGSGNILVMHTARDQSRFRAQLGIALVTIAVTGALFTAVVAILSLTAFRGTAFGSLLIPLALSELVLARVSDLAAQSFQAHERLRTSANIVVAQSLIRLGAVALFAVALRGGSVEDFVSWYLVATAIVGVGSLALVVARLAPPSFAELRIGGRLREGFFFSLGTGSKTVYGDIDKFMLVRFNQSAAAGIYTAAYRLVAMAFAPIFAFCYSNNVRFFRVGATGPTAVWRVVTRALPLVLAYSAATAVVVFLCAPLLPLVLGASYRPSVSALRWLAVMPILMGTHSLLGDALMGLGRQAARATMQAGTAAVNIALNVWLIPAFSWRGAAVASIISEGLLAVGLTILLRRMVLHEHRGKPTAWAPEPIGAGGR